jgi:hypothetical protein
MVMSEGLMPMAEEAATAAVREHKSPVHINNRQSGKLNIQLASNDYQREFTRRRKKKKKSECSSFSEEAIRIV